MCDICRVPIVFIVPCSADIGGERYRLVSRRVGSRDGGVGVRSTHTLSISLARPAVGKLVGLCCGRTPPQYDMACACRRGVLLSGGSSRGCVHPAAGSDVSLAVLPTARCQPHHVPSTAADRPGPTRNALKLLGTVSANKEGLAWCWTGRQLVRLYRKYSVISKAQHFRLI